MCACDLQNDAIRWHVSRLFIELSVFQVQSSVNQCPRQGNVTETIRAIQIVLRQFAMHHVHLHKKDPTQVGRFFSNQQENINLKSNEMSKFVKLSFKQNKWAT